MLLWSTIVSTVLVFQVCSPGCPSSYPSLLLKQSTKAFCPSILPFCPKCAQSMPKIYLYLFTISSLDVSSHHWLFLHPKRHLDVGTSISMWLHPCAKDKKTKIRQNDDKTLHNHLGFYFSCFALLWAHYQSCHFSMNSPRGNLEVGTFSSTYW